MTSRRSDSSIRRHSSSIRRPTREAHNRHRGALVRFTDRPNSAKSTTAYGLDERFCADHRPPYLFDGDSVRHGTCRDFGFSQRDREENSRRTGEVASLFIDGDIIAVATFISSYATDRKNVHNLVKAANLIEACGRCPAEVRESRDVKGNYAKARAGIIIQFTGVWAPCEAPASSDLVLDTDPLSVDECVAPELSVLKYRPRFSELDGCGVV